RLIQESTRVVAQVDDIAPDLVHADLLVDLLDRRFEAVEGLRVERRHADVADIALFTGAHGMNRDDIAHKPDVERLLGAGPADRQGNRRIDLAAHAFDGLAEVETLNGLAVECDDHVAGEDAGAGGGRVIDRRDDLDYALLHG